MEFRKSTLNGNDRRSSQWVPIIEFKTAPDRDTAALMIEAMVWWAENPAHYLCHVTTKACPDRFYVRSDVAAFPLAATPWDAILAAKEASK